MTRKFHIILIISCIFLSAGWVSCKKHEFLSTPTSKVAGKWKKVRYATDDNVNGQLEDWETHAVDPTTSSTLEFKRDSTGIEQGSNIQDLPFRWWMNGELSLMMIYNTGDTFVYKITQINAAHLNVTTKTKNGLAGYYYDTDK